MLLPGRYVFVYGVFYPDERRTRVRGQAHRLPRPQAATSSASRSRTGGSTRSGSSATSTSKAEFGDGADRLPPSTAPNLDLDGIKDGSGRQETDTISRLVYGFASAYLLTGDDRYLEAAEKGTEYLREHLRFDDNEARTSPTGTTRST